MGIEPGRPLVLLHGFTNTGASWGPVKAALGTRYRPIAPDIRGHGSASALRPVTLAAVIADLAAVTDAPRFTLGGYSMGGRIALQVAVALPGRVDRLVLVGASPGLAEPDERAARRAADEALADEIEGSSIEEFAVRWAQTPVLQGVSDAVAAAAYADRLRSTPAGLAAALRGLGTGALPSLWDRLGELTMPVTLIAGERDAKFTAIARTMAARIANASLTVIPGVGHAAHLEDPEAVAAAI